MMSSTMIGIKIGYELKQGSPLKYGYILDKIEVLNNPPDGSSFGPISITGYLVQDENSDKVNSIACWRVKSIINK